MKEENSREFHLITGEMGAKAFKDALERMLIAEKELARAEFFGNGISTKKYPRRKLK